MKQSVPRLIAIILCALCISASNIASADNTDIHIIDKQRFAEVLGSAMSNIVGESIEDFTLFSIKDDTLVPVPFQFNEYDLEGYVYFKSSKIKGNKIHSEIKINTSSSQENSLKAFLNFIEVVAN